MSFNPPSSAPQNKCASSIYLSLGFPLLLPLLFLFLFLFLNQQSTSSHLSNHPLQLFALQKNIGKSLVHTHSYILPLLTLY